MKNLITIFLMGILSTAYTQTMRITYFRAAETKSNINLYWQTFVEDGQDTFKIYRSINSDECDYAEDNWELLTKVPNDNKKNGQYYNTNIKLEGGKRYYRIVWGDYNYKMYTTLTVKETNQVENIHSNGNSIIISNKKFGDTFNLYSITNGLIAENIESEYNISTLSNGIYVVRNMETGKSVKILK